MFEVWEGIDGLGIVRAAGTRRQARKIPIGGSRTPIKTGGVDTKCAPGYTLVNGTCRSLGVVDPINPVLPCPRGQYRDNSGRCLNSSGPTVYDPVPPTQSGSPYTPSYISKYIAIYGKPPIQPGYYKDTSWLANQVWSASPGGPGIPDTGSGMGDIVDEWGNILYPLTVLAVIGYWWFFLRKRK